MRYFERGLLKSYLTFFLSNPVTFNRQGYQKQKRPGTSLKQYFSKSHVIGGVVVIVGWGR